MTIPTGSKLLVTSPKPASVAADRAQGNSPAGLNAPDGTATKPSSENDFRSVLDKQMTQASVHKNDENTDVKEFSAEQDGFCCVQDVAPELTEMPLADEAEWLHGLMPFLPESNELKAVLQGDAEAIDLENELALGQVILPAMSNRDAKGGDSLPPMRQVDSVNLSSLMTRNAAALATSTSIPVEQELVHFKLSSAEAIDAESAELEQSLLKPESFKSAANELNLAALKEGFVAVQGSASGLNVISAGTTVTGLNQAAPEMQLSTQVPASQLANALGEKVAFLINHKLNTAEIRLDPPHLGKLDIQIQIKDDAATVVIHTQHAQTRDMIDSASARLREFLQEAGYNSVNVDVSQREQSFNGDNLSGQDAHPQDDVTAGSAQEQTSAGWQQSVISMQMNDGRIDYFA